MIEYLRYFNRSINHRRVRLSPTKATEWYTKAAEQGDINSQKALVELKNKASQ